MRLRTIILAVLALGGSFAGATVGMQLLLSGSPTERRPVLADVPPLPPVTRTSTVIAPTAIALTAIRDAMEREVPQNFIGKRDTPLAQVLSNAEIGWNATRGPIALAGRPDTLVATTAVNGTLRATGQISQQAAGSVGNAISSFLGQDVGRSVERLAGRTFDQRADVRGNVTVTARPSITAAWRLEPNLAMQVSVADANLTLAGVRLNVSNEVRPHLERTINERVTALESRLRNDTFIERLARREWAKMCRSVPLGAAGAGAPNLWLEVRPTRAFAAQPRIDATNLVLTLGVQAETRIVPAETSPDCPFPAKLDLVDRAERGRVNIAVPIDVPFTEVNELIAAQLVGKTLPAGQGGVAVTIKSAVLAASGDRLLISLQFKASETRSWFGLGADASVHIWARPVLDRERQVLRLADVSLAVESEGAFVGVATRTMQSYLETAVAEHAVIDLKPFAANARARIETAITDFRVRGDGVRVDASVIDLRLVDVAFDARTLRVFAAADGTANVTVTALPER